MQAPELAELQAMFLEEVQRDFREPAWAFEVKYDGSRILAEWDAHGAGSRVDATRTWRKNLSSARVPKLLRQRGDSVMDRRTFMGIAGMGLLACNSIAGAQPTAKVWRVGFLASGARPADGAPPAVLRDELQALGY